MVTLPTVILYELPVISPYLELDMAKFLRNEIAYQYYGKPIHHFLRLRSSSPKYQAIWNSRITLVSSHGASVGEHLLWSRLRPRYCLHWRDCPGT